MVPPKIPQDPPVDSISCSAKRLDGKNPEQLSKICSAERLDSTNPEQFSKICSAERLDNKNKTINASQHNAAPIAIQSPIAGGGGVSPQAHSIIY